MHRYLLDTNVLSEPMRPRPAATVLRWLDARNPANLFLSAITLGELASGMHRLESSARRRALERWLSDVVVTQFEGRILAFDTDVAWRWGEMIAGAAASELTRRKTVIAQGVFRRRADQETSGPARGNAPT